MWDELKPCPFCGGEAVWVEDGSGFYVTCKNCHADGPFDLGKSGAIAAWNEREPAEPEGDK